MTPAVSRIAFFRNPDTPRQFRVPPVCADRWTENDWLQTVQHYPEPTREELRALVNPRRLAIMREHYPELTQEQQENAIMTCTHLHLPAPLNRAYPQSTPEWEENFRAVSAAREQWGKVIRLLFPYDSTDPWGADPDYATYRDAITNPNA